VFVCDLMPFGMGFFWLKLAFQLRRLKVCLSYVSKFID
jgi:hypothetical protein